MIAFSPLDDMAAKIKINWYVIDPLDTIGLKSIILNFKD